MSNKKNIIILLWAVILAIVFIIISYRLYIETAFQNNTIVIDDVSSQHNISYKNTGCLPWSDCLDTDEILYENYIHKTQIKYKNDCLNTKCDLVNSIYQQDYCFYQNIKEKHWEEIADKILYFEDALILWSFFVSRDNFSESIICSSK